MKVIDQEQITNYILGAITVPFQGRKQLETLVILHFDIPDNKASEMVRDALIYAIEIYRRMERKTEGELRQIKYTINRLVECTPEAKP